MTAQLHQLANDLARFERLKDVTAINASSLPDDADTGLRVRLSRRYERGLSPGIVDGNAIERLRYEESLAGASARGTTIAL